MNYLHRFYECGCCPHRYATTAGCPYHMRIECERKHTAPPSNSSAAKPYMTGWICPKCGMIHGPSVAHCFCGNGLEIRYQEKGGVDE